jgi:hypothetical protein
LPILRKIKSAEAIRKNLLLPIKVLNCSFKKTKQ